MTDTDYSKALETWKRNRMDADGIYKTTLAHEEVCFRAGFLAALKLAEEKMPSERLEDTDAAPWERNQIVGWNELHRGMSERLAALKAGAA
jgi:hypothetical protein